MNATMQWTRGRWARPTALYLDLGVGVSSRIDTEGSQFGWEIWRGTIWAEWDLEATEPDALPPLGSITGWRDTKPEFEEAGLKLQVGELERWLLRLDGEDLGNRSGMTVDSPMALFEAGDAISSDLAELMEALMGDEDSLFCEACYQITGQEGPDFDRLLVLREIEILRSLRGYGVGAWASARSIGVLARDVGTLLATMAAPLHRVEFLTGPDRDEHRDLSPAEEDAWRAAQLKIGQHWQSTVGLAPLPPHPSVLVGTVETARVALDRSLGAWTDRD